METQMKLPIVPDGLPTIDPEVREILRTEAQEHSGWADFQNRWGLLLFLEGNYAEAVAVFARCLTINPSYAWASLNHLQALALAGEIQKARAGLSTLTEPAPGALVWARAFLDLMDPAAVPRDPLDGIPDSLRRRPDFSRLLSLHAQGKTPDEPRLLVPGMHQLLKEASTWEARLGREDQAQALAAAMLAFWHEPGAYWAQAGFLASLRGDDDLSLRAYEEAARVAPNSPEAMIALAYHWSAVGDAERAHVALTEALRRAPRFADLHYQMGLIETARGRPEVALEAFRSALGLNSHYTVARLQEAESLVALQRWEEAREAYVRVIDAGLQSTDLYLHLGQVEERLGRPGVAEEAYLAALRLNPEEPLVHFHLGHLHRARGDRKKAKRAWRRFLVLAGESEQAEAIRTQLEADQDL